MLKTTISKTINGTASVKNADEEIHVVYMSASINEDGNTNINKNIVNKEMYEANKADIRKDMAAFDTIVYEQEDVT